MQYTFVDKSEEEKNIICNILDKYCVKHTEEEKDYSTALYTIKAYDIIIDLDEKTEHTWSDGSVKTPYLFITDKVKEVLNVVNSYDLPAVEHPTAFDNQAEMEKSLAPRNLWEKVTDTFGIWKEKLLNIFEKEETNEEDLSDTQVMDMLSGMYQRLFGGFDENDPDVKTVKFDNLSEEIQQILSDKVPKSILESDRCVIQLKGNILNVYLR